MEDNVTHKLMLYNDEHNSFPYVMACLIRFCKHEPLQAEQCALLVHLNGYCSIKSGDFIELSGLSENLSNLDLNVSIEEYESNMY
jgi:ATP-dependent Clp protease adaptor protein ClpS